MTFFILSLLCKFIPSFFCNFCPFFGIKHTLYIYIYAQSQFDFHNNYFCKQKGDKNPQTDLSVWGLIINISLFKIFRFFIRAYRLPRQEIFAFKFKHCFDKEIVAVDYWLMHTPAVAFCTHLQKAIFF